MSVRFLLSLAVLLALTSAALPQQRALRLALVIGNANYPDRRLGREDDGAV